MTIAPVPPISKLIQRLITSFATTIFLLTSTGTHAETHQEWLIFPQIDLNYRSGTSHPTSPKQREITPSLDIFYSSGHNEMKWLAELFASEDESGFERLQVGWSANDNSTI